MRSHTGSSAAAASATHELRADRAGEISVRCLPGAISGIAEDGVTEFVDHNVGVAMQQLGNMLGIDAAAFVEDDSQRIASTGDDGWCRRRDDPIGEDRPGLCLIRFDVVVLDRGNQPAIRVVQERLEIGPAMGFADLTAFLILRDRNRCVVNRPEVVAAIVPAKSAGFWYPSDECGRKRLYNTTTEHPQDGGS
ncbi:hypothetical protein FHS25_007076 [Rhizobium laguerreae]|uniref:Uncharacterized protein n=1 Tax=Rhizobium laguerreae TaxID=1076926 RepID=A0ABR6GJT1_9HYPH|nr:hypothetical protein [Rhizobium laguerreae]